MLHIVESRKSLDRLAKDLEQARGPSQVRRARRLRPQAKMAEKGMAFDRECRVFEVCNP